MIKADQEDLFNSHQSHGIGDSVNWFSTLISKKGTLKGALGPLNKAKTGDIKIIEMGQGSKSSHFIVWSFLSKKQQKEWAKGRWE